MSRAIATATYKKYAKKYGIKSTNKTIKQLQKAIYKYEMKHSKKLFNKKPDRRGNYGLYLVEKN